MSEAFVYIAGEWVSASATQDIISPETGERIGSFIVTDTGLVDKAIGAARTALPAWRGLSVADRCVFLSRFADLLMEEYGEPNVPTPLKQLIQSEMGKRLPEADIEVVESADIVRYFADHAAQILRPQDVPIEAELWSSKRSVLHFDAHGVIGVIKPWNYPLELPLWAIAPALAAGNTIVFKPSEYSNLVGLQIAHLFDKAALPPGVLNVVTGDGAVGKYITQHSQIDMVSFTGSRHAGTEVATAAAAHLAPVSLELGGNDAAIVLDDADLELAVNGVMWGGICNSGQVCVGVKRVMVHRSLAEVFERRLLEKVAKLRPRIDYGPIVSRRQFRLLEQQVAQTLKEGALLLIGGCPLEEIGPLYYAPTVLSQVGPGMTISREECFGPVLPITYFDGADEVAVELANDSEYGLGASIWTKNIRRGAELAKQIDAGMVWINDVNVALAEAPWGGRRGSGYGVELSSWGLYKYTVLKHVSIETSRDDRRDWWFPYNKS